MKQSITEEHIVDWLLEEVSGLRPFFEVENEERETGWNSYSLFSYVLNPYLKSLLKKKAFQELKHTFVSVERLTRFGEEHVRNQLYVALEELDEEHHLLWPFFGPILKEHTRHAIIEYPTVNQNQEPINQFIDQNVYSKRWEQEVRDIGGWHKLTIPHLLYIRYQLVQEFNMEGFHIIKPGGKEWKDADLPWPI